MDQVHVVRHKVLVEGHAIRQVAREMGVARNTVKRYLERAAPVRVDRAEGAADVRAGARAAAGAAEGVAAVDGRQAAADGDGCPDPDNDNDLVPDADDLCPNVEALEDHDDNEDGCTD